MKNFSTLILLAIVLLVFNISCAGKARTGEKQPLTKRALVSDMPERIKALPRTKIDYNRTLLSQEDVKVVQKLIEASKLIDQIYWLQVSEENPKIHSDLVTWAAGSEDYRRALEYFEMVKGRWDPLKENEPFLGPLGPEGKRPPGAGFYPPDMTKEEFESWIAAHPEDKEAFQGLFTVIRRAEGKLVSVPFSKYYREYLEPAASKLREAAAITSNQTLKDFLNKRADAFLSDNYYESDVAWMDLESPIEVVIGPYEVYDDEMFNYKAAFEVYINAVDKPESDKLKIYTQHLPDMERNLPMPDEHKNPNRGTESPIRVVQEIYTAGQARNGVQTAAFNLPNDEQVREAKGSKKVLLKNVMEAKFSQSGKPIALRLLDPSQQNLLSFDAYFNHTLFHELSHGLGPGLIMVDGKRVENRLLLKELYSPIEECKADVLGIWNLFYSLDKKLVTSFTEEHLLATDAGLLFRSMRFGIDEAHGRGSAVQWNWYRERNAIVPTSGGRYKVDFQKMKDSVKSLATELLLIEATGDYERAKKLMETYGVSNPEIDTIIAGLKDIPVDITPVFIAAGEQ